MLTYLAANRPYAFWFGDDDAAQGAAALAAQLIGLHNPRFPLVSPTIDRYVNALEDLLEEIAAHRATNTPIAILIDPPTRGVQPRDPLPPPIPVQIPPGILIVYGCKPGEALPRPATTRLVLPATSDEAFRDQVAALERQNCPKSWRMLIAMAARGNFLYARLAYRLIHERVLNITALPSDLKGLLDAWWEQLDAVGQKQMLLLAAAGEPLPYTISAALCESNPQLALRKGLAHGIVVEAAHQTVGTTRCFNLYHPAIREYIAHRHGAALARAHAEILDLARRQGLLASHRQSAATSAPRAYLSRQFSRHAAFGPNTIRSSALPLVSQRAWVRMQERYNNNLVNAARDLAWEFNDARKHGPLVRLIRDAVLAGTLASQARMLNPDAVVETLSVALKHNGRETGLKRVQDIVEQLPDGRNKAFVLRQLGEACYNARMRTSAMRLLSRALDLEEQAFPHTWTEQREQFLAALAMTALTQINVDAALAMSARIKHKERRGMAETQIARWLVEHNEPRRALEVARGIEHESQGAWSRAEVAVALARAGDSIADTVLQHDIQIGTAAAWAQIELACDNAATDENSARQRIEQLDTPNQRDRGLTQLAHTLALANKDGDALTAAEQISDVETRVSALLNLRLTLEGLVAMLALERATAEIDALTGDARAPLLAALAAAHASLGRRQRALSIVEQLAEGEERDRALSRVAVAFARYGDYEQARELASSIADNDERDWALDEMARCLETAGHRKDAETFAQAINDNDQRNRTLAELAIARAHAENPLSALRLALSIPKPVERARALTMIVPELVAAKHIDAALAVSRSSAHPNDDTPLPHTKARSRYHAALVAALAECGELEFAQRQIDAIAYPLDRARAFLALARTTAPRNDQQAFAMLGEALSIATIGREETLRVLEQSAPILGMLGGSEILLLIAEAIDEVDGW